MHRMRKRNNYIFDGCLAEYKYYDMDDVIKNVLNYVKRILTN